MRITIGGILLFGGIATVAVVGPLSNSGDVLKQAVEGVTSLVKSVAGPAVVPAPPSIPSTNTSTASVVAVPLVSSATVKPITAAASMAPIAPAVVESAPSPEPAAATKAIPGKRASRRHRRSRRKRVVAAKAAMTANPANSAKAGSGSDDPLMGRYVSVKLKSGRDVKGILRERTAQGITLEIPGMGPFQYPNSNIDGVKAAE